MPANIYAKHKFIFRNQPPHPLDVWRKECGVIRYCEFNYVKLKITEQLYCMSKRKQLMLGMHCVMHGIYCWPTYEENKQEKKNKKNKRVPLMLAISILERSAQICFFVSVTVACDMVSFGVKFLSDSVNNGRVSEGWIFTTIPICKILMCGGHVIMPSLWHAYSVVMAAQLTTVSFDTSQHKCMRESKYNRTKSPVESYSVLYCANTYWTR